MREMCIRDSPYAVSATLSGGLLILRDDADVWAFENGTTGGIRVYDLATGAELPVPETALDCLVVDEDSQRLIFNCYDLPEGLTYAYDDPDQPLHQYVLITDREGNVLMREDGCTASSLASYRGGFADWLDLSWFRSSDWGITREALYNVTTGELLTGEEDSAVSACGVGVACLQSRQDSRSVLYDLNGGEAVELGRFDRGVNTYTPGCVVLSGSDDPDSPYTLIDLASGESIGAVSYTHLDPTIAKRAGLLHDIGKSIDHEVEGTHIQIGVDLAKKYKESDAVTVSYTHLDVYKRQEFTQLDNGKSIIRYLPPNGTAGFASFLVSTPRREP